MAMNFGETFGAHTLGTFVGGTAALPPGVLLYDLVKTKLLKTAAPAPKYMEDTFKKEVIGQGVAEGLKIHQLKTIKWAAGFYAAAAAALTVMPTIVSMMHRKAAAGRTQLASGVQQIGEKAANNIKEATHQSALVITPEQK